MDKNKKKIDSIVGDYKYGFKTQNEPFFSIPKGISEEVVSKISKYKKEPEWMTNKRLEAYREFAKRPNPKWGPDLSFIDFDNTSNALGCSDSLASSARVSKERTPVLIKSLYVLRENS